MAQRCFTTSAECCCSNLFITFYLLQMGWPLASKRNCCPFFFSDNFPHFSCYNGRLYFYCPFWDFPPLLIHVIANAVVIVFVAAAPTTWVKNEKKKQNKNIAKLCLVVATSSFLQTCNYVRILWIIHALNPASPGLNPATPPKMTGGEMGFGSFLCCPQIAFNLFCLLQIKNLHKAKCFPRTVFADCIKMFNIA